MNIGDETITAATGFVTGLGKCTSKFDEFKRDEYAPPPLMKRLNTAGRLGRKSRRGFYDYTQ